jgi:CRISPR-associated protein Cas5d
MMRYKLLVWGDYACFTRPEMKVERVSYEVMTPSAARAIMETILWKPGLQWRIEAIDILRPITFMNIRRNEVSETLPLTSAQTVMKRCHGQLELDVADNRQLRSNKILQNVAYCIHAQLTLPAESSYQQLTKYSEMFKRRAVRGQCVTQPYLGCREFSAYFKLIADHTSPPQAQPFDRELGYMLYDLDYTQLPPMPMFFNACIQQGRLIVPPPDSKEVLT